MLTERRDNPGRGASTPGSTPTVGPQSLDIRIPAAAKALLERCRKRIAGDRVYLQGAIGRNSGVIALNRTDGKVVWAKVVGPAQGNDKGGGPRSTPTVDGDRVYVLTENGDLACFGMDGAILWQRNIGKDFRGRQIQWLISDGRFYVRNQDIVKVYNIKSPATP